MTKSPPKPSENVLLLERQHIRQGSNEDVGAEEEKLRARARVIQDMERVEYAHES